MPNVLNIGDLAKPVEKLIEVVERGIGAVLLPWQIVRVARAEAEASKIRALAERAVAALPPAPTDGLLVLDAELLPPDGEAEEEPIPLIRRAEMRMLYREGQRQVNVENVVREAYQNLGDEAADDPVDDDWVARFFGYAPDVSNEEMQTLWGKILAGEVRRPGSFSMRCLETVRSLGRAEAELFRKTCTYVVMGDSILKSNVNTAFIKDLPIAAFLALADAGLMNPSTQLGRSLSSDVPGDDFECGFVHHDLYLRLRRPGAHPGPFEEVYRLSAAGRELVPLMVQRASRSYANELVEWGKSRGFEVSVHQRTPHGAHHSVAPLPLPLTDD